ncbi:hypothetical protein EDB83DRAFT_2373750 [Lactarius deliciosus]|nr:hypothetical protein EDB83DRAFT_2373750 [Lactarius deliciosus]
MGGDMSLRAPFALYEQTGNAGGAQRGEGAQTAGAPPPHCCAAPAPTPLPMRTGVARANPNGRGPPRTPREWEGDDARAEGHARNTRSSAAAPPGSRAGVTRKPGAAQAPPSPFAPPVCAQGPAREREAACKGEGGAPQPAAAPPPSSRVLRDESRRANRRPHGSAPPPPLWARHKGRRPGVPNPGGPPLRKGTASPPMKGSAEWARCGVMRNGARGPISPPPAFAPPYSTT